MRAVYRRCAYKVGMSPGFIFSSQCCKTVLSTQFVLENFHPPRIRQVKLICEECVRDFQKMRDAALGCWSALWLCHGTWFQYDWLPDHLFRKSSPNGRNFRYACITLETLFKHVQNPILHIVSRAWFQVPNSENCPLWRSIFIFWWCVYHWRHPGYLQSLLV